METKYQESLDYLNKPLNWKNNAIEIGKHILVLQELIDNYNLLSEFIEMDKVIELVKEHKFDKAIFFNSKNLVVNGVSYEQLEKALLLACKKIGYLQDDIEVLNGFKEEPETQEEAQSTSIYNQYTRPKEIAKKFIEKVQKESERNNE